MAATRQGTLANSRAFPFAEAAMHCLSVVIEVNGECEWNKPEVSKGHSVQILVQILGESPSVHMLPAEEVTESLMTVSPDFRHNCRCQVSTILRTER
jgi:hypothetical protein